MKVTWGPLWGKRMMGQRKKKGGNERGERGEFINKFKFLLWFAGFHKKMDSEELFYSFFLSVDLWLKPVICYCNGQKK